MNRAAIVKYINNLPYTMYGRKGGYLKSEWHSFKPESLAVLQSIQLKEVPYLFIDTTKHELRLKRKI